MTTTSADQPDRSPYGRVYFAAMTGDDHEARIEAARLAYEAATEVESEQLDDAFELDLARVQAKSAMVSFGGNLLTAAAALRLPLSVRAAASFFPVRRDS